jgi:hypothetical protein
MTFRFIVFFILSFLIAQTVLHEVNNPRHDGEHTGACGPAPSYAPTTPR